MRVVTAASCNIPSKGLGGLATGLPVWGGVEGSCFSPDTHSFPQDHCGSNPGTFRVLVGNEGCSVPSLKCRKRITILVEGGEIELFDGEVSVGRSPHPQSPRQLMGSSAQHSFRTCVVEHDAAGGETLPRPARGAGADGDGF